GSEWWGFGLQSELVVQRIRRRHQAGFGLSEHLLWPSLCDLAHGPRERSGQADRRKYRYGFSFLSRAWHLPSGSHGRDDKLAVSEQRATRYKCLRENCRRSPSNRKFNIK